MDNATSVLLQYGIAGVAMITEAWVIIRLYNDNKKLQLDKDLLQEARRIDAKETIEKITTPLQSLSQTMNLVYDKLKASKEV